MSDQYDNRHLGDGAYASFDGYHVRLAANHHENKVIALDPQVMEALILYANKHMFADKYVKLSRVKRVLDGEVGSSTLDLIDEI